MGIPGAVQAAALQGTAAPAGGNYSSFQDPVLNGAGQVAFVATLTGDGVTTANDGGLYAGSVGGLVKVVREGDQVDVDPGAGVDLRTIGSSGVNFTTGSGGEDGRGVSFTDTGFLCLPAVIHRRLVRHLRVPNCSGAGACQYAPDGRSVHGPRSASSAAGGESMSEQP